MMISRTILFAALLGALVGSNMKAQPRRGQGANGNGMAAQGAITGTVSDSASGEALARASVALRSAADSSLVTGAITERDGSFSINGVRPGRYYARVSFVGYRTRVVSGIVVTPAASTVELGKILMAPSTSGGDEVTVNARREFMTMAIDRTIYKTSDMGVAAGGTTIDVLKNLPAIDVDADDNISLKGSQNVVIQINGRPSMVTGAMLATFLRGLPADAVERVEVIPNPSAKYDPDGMSGIINIVLKQNTDRGTSGGVTGSIGTHDNYSIGGNVSYGSGPWSLFANYGFNYNDRENFGSYLRTTTLPGLPRYLEQASSGDRIGPGHVLNASVDYAIDKDQTLSLSVMGNKRIENGSGMNNYIERDSTMAVTRRYERSNGRHDDDDGLDLRLSHKWAIQPTKHEVSSEIRFSTDRSNDANDYTSRDLALDGGQLDSLPTRQHTAEDRTNRQMTLQTDYMRPLGDDMRLEAGYKGEIERISSGFFSQTMDNAGGAFVPDTALNNNFDYDRQIHAAYATLGRDFGRFSAQAGVRAEQALTRFTLAQTGQAYDNDYFSLFPSAFVMYKPSDALMLKASYSRRINRPSTRALNPFPGLDDPYMRRMGNPALRPEYTDAYELSATQFTDVASISLTGYYRRTTDVMRRYSATDTTGITTSSWANFSENRSYGADVTATVRLGDWLNGLVFVSAYQTVTNAENVDASFNTDAFQWTMRANATITPIAGLDFQTSFFYRPATQNEGARTVAMTHLDFSLQQKVFGDRGRIGIRANDPFDLHHFGMTRTDEFSTITTDRRFTSRTFALTFSYTFGSPDASRRQRQGGQQQQQDSDME